MRIKKEKRKYSLFLLPLMCLTLFAGAMATGVTYSSYTSVASSDGDSATVAKFDVAATIGNVTSADKEQVQIPITVTNNSEVTVSYDVVVTLPKALPYNNETEKGVVCTVNGKVGTESTDRCTVTVSGCDTIAAGGNASATLIIGSEEVGASGISDLNSLTYENVTVKVIVTQVD